MQIASQVQLLKYSLGIGARCGYQQWWCLIKTFSSSDMIKEDRMRNRVHFYPKRSTTHISAWSGLIIGTGHLTTTRVHVSF